jgi:hypothetical protein
MNEPVTQTIAVPMTAREQVEIRTMALRRGIPLGQLVADLLRRELASEGVASPGHSVRVAS